MVKIKWAPNFQAMRTQVERTVMAQIEKVLVNAVGNAKCNIHSKPTEIHVSGKSLDKLEFQVEGCCQDMIETVENKLSNL